MLRFILFALIHFLGLVSLHAQKPVLVKDINPGIESGCVGLIEANINNISYFWASDKTHGYELWRSDGTLSGTYIVKDINPGIENAFNTSTEYSRFCIRDAIMYFGANDGVHGRELWRSDGTTAGTYLVKDIYPGPYSGYTGYWLGTGNYTTVNGVMYFSGRDEEHGSELWRSDGTTAGTYLVKDIYPGPYSGYNGIKEGIGYGYGIGNGNTVNGVIYFSAVDEEHGSELWRSDGTTAGTYLVKDIYPGPYSGYSGYGYGYGDGYGTINGFGDGYGTGNYTTINGVMYFGGRDEEHGRELWRSDGTTAGTYLVKDIYPGLYSGYYGYGYEIGFGNNTTVNGVMYFRGEDEEHGSELWRSDGTTAGTYLVKDIYPGLYSGYTGAGYGFGNNTTLNGVMYFSAVDEEHGSELWRSDGTTAGTYLVKDIYPGYIGGYYGYEDGNGYGNNTTVNGVMYFGGRDEKHGSELWRTDGTTAGTYLVKDIYPGYIGGYYGYENGNTINGVMYFGGMDEEHGTELWRSDGTTAGTYLVKDIYPGYTGGYYGYEYGNNTALNGVMYFGGGDEEHGMELWKIGGTNIQHYHQLTQNSSFQNRQLLTSGNNFQICADGSEASVFKVSGDNQDYSQAVIKIPGTDVSQIGSFSVIQQNKDSLVVRYKHPDYIQTPGVSATLVASVYATSTSATPLTTFDLTVYRAPVLMVHGLWSNASSFEAMETTLRGSQLYPANPNLLRRADYSSTNTWTFALNVPKIKTEIEQLIQSLRNANVAAGNVDYVGHSMGGILGRMYLQGDTYQCGFHKLVTLNTPHSGSQMANFLVNNAELACNIVLPKVMGVNADACSGGAVDNLRVDSPVIRNTLNGSRLNYRTVAAHTVATTEYQTPQAITSGLLTTVLQARPKTLIKDIAWYTFSDVLPKALFDMGTSAVYDGLNDWVVSVISQQGGMLGNCTTLIENQIHTGSPANAQVIQRVKDLLMTNPQSASFCQYFNPARISYGSGGGRIAALNSTTTDGTIRIVSPGLSQTVAAGSSLNISIVGTNLTEIKTFVDYNTDSTYAARTSGSQATLSLIADRRFPGKKSVVVLGRTSSGSYVADTTHFYVSNNSSSNGTCQSIQSGNWSSSTTWSCGHEPIATDIVTINTGHTVIISTSAAQASRIIYNGGKIIFATTNAKVFLKGGD